MQVLLVVGGSIGGLWWSSVHQSTSSTRSVAAHRPSLRFATTIRANCCCARLHTKLYTIQILQIQIQIQIQNLQNLANWFCTRLPTKLCICLYTEEMQRIHKYRHKLCYTIILVQLQKLHICPNMVISGLHIQQNSSEQYFSSKPMPAKCYLWSSAKCIEMAMMAEQWCNQWWRRRGLT